MTLKDYFKDDKFAMNAGVEILDIKEGYAKGRMLVTEEHLNANGACQGGAIFTLADTLFAACANSHKLITVSTSSQITYFRPGRLGYLYAEAHEVFDHKRLPYCRVDVTNESGELVAVLNGNGYRRSDIQIPVDELI